MFILKYKDTSHLFRLMKFDTEGKRSCFFFKKKRKLACTQIFVGLIGNISSQSNVILHSIFIEEAMLKSGCLCKFFKNWWLCCLLMYHVHCLVGVHFQSLVCCSLSYPKEYSLRQGAALWPQVSQNGPNDSSQRSKTPSDVKKTVKWQFSLSFRGTCNYQLFCRTLVLITCW